MIRILWILCLWMLSLFAHAWSWEDLWRTKDQQGVQAMRQGNPEKAAKVFQSPAWRGVANYRSNNFEGAAADFAHLNTDISHYNRGNALAKSQRLQEALNEYDQALKLNPHFSDAKTNREIVKKLLENQPKENQSSSSSNEQQGSSQSKDSNKNSSSSSNQQQASSESKDSQMKSTSGPTDRQDSFQKNDALNNVQNNSSQHKNNDPSNSDRNTDKNQGARSAQDEYKNKQQTSGMASQFLNQNHSNKIDEKDQQWLQKIPDDPGGLLRRKFIRDYEREQQGESS